METVIRSVNSFIVGMLPKEASIKTPTQIKPNKFNFIFDYRGQKYSGTYIPRDHDFAFAFHTIEGGHWINFSSTSKWDEEEKLRDQLPKYYLPETFY